MIWLRDTSGTWPSRGLKIEWPMQEELTRGLVRALSTNHFHPCQSFDIVQGVYSGSTGIFKSCFLVFSSLLNYPVFPFLVAQYLLSQVLLSWKWIHFQCAVLVSLQRASGKNDNNKICASVGISLPCKCLFRCSTDVFWEVLRKSLIPWALVWIGWAPSEEGGLVAKCWWCMINKKSSWN